MSKNINLQTLKGFRDFLPAEKRKRDWVAAKIKTVFEKFGFEPLETPTLEYADLLLGKYGDEADKLVYSFEDRGNRQVALRYDQTVPSARVLSQYENQLPKYFRRYQIQNVFRADKPQKGRFREFTQCDIDIFGSTSPLADAEILACTYFAYQELGFSKIQLKINDRQVLVETLAEFTTPQVDVFSIIQSVDKLDKLSNEEVTQELVKKGLSLNQAQQVLKTLEKIEISPALNKIVSAAQELGVPPAALVFDSKLARGLDYYTGMIFEIVSADYPSGSLGGGGRYNNLIGQLGGPTIPAVGVAFGFDRTVEAAQQLNLIPEEVVIGPQVMVALFDQDLIDPALNLSNQLRKNGIATLLYPEVDKLGKQFKYASQLQIPFVAILGNDELQTKKVTLKNMVSREQQTLDLDEVIKYLQKN